jgi:hypothetical protein
MHALAGRLLGISPERLLVYICILGLEPINVSVFCGVGMVVFFSAAAHQESLWWLPSRQSQTLQATCECARASFIRFRGHNDCHSSIAAACPYRDAAMHASRRHQRSHCRFAVHHNLPACWI